VILAKVQISGDLGKVIFTNLCIIKYNFFFMAQLIEIGGFFQIDPGAPNPLVIAKNGTLYVLFYADSSMEYENYPQQRNEVYDTGIITLKFLGLHKFTFGLPGNETLHGHPYSIHGIESFGFYEVRNSDFIESLIEIESIHPYFEREKWDNLKHYVLTFHDDMLECIASDFEVEEEKTSHFHKGEIVLHRLMAEDF
jgi:hypothetical protein